MPAARCELLDVNVWLALSVERHSHHSAALSAWEGFHRPGFCRMTQLWLLRLWCNETVMGADVMRPETAWKTCRRMTVQSKITFVEEPPGIEAAVEEYCAGRGRSRDFWSDCYLAAFARSAGLQLVTFDAGFREFKGLDLLLLKS